MFGQEQNFMIFGPNQEARMSDPTKDESRGYKNWDRIRELGGRDLVEKWGEFAFQLCIMKREILDPSVAPHAIEVPNLWSQEKTGSVEEPGVL